MNRLRKNIHYVMLLFMLSAALQAMAEGPARRAGTVHQTSRPVVARPDPKASSPDTGILGWLKSLLPRSLSFRGPAIFSGSQPETLATADCFNSGAGVSCEGFRSMEEYLAAVHASQNLGIPFERVKAKIQTGRTLHQAIRELRPTANAQIEAWKAERQARQTIGDSAS